MNHCGGPLDHSSLENCFNSAKLDNDYSHVTTYQSNSSTDFDQPVKIQNLLFLGGHSEVEEVFWVIVLLQNPSTVQLDVMNGWQDILLQDVC